MTAQEQAEKLDATESYIQWIRETGIVGGGPIYPAFIAGYQAALRTARNEALEECAKVAEAMCPTGGRQWTEEQLACFGALTTCAAACRALKG